MTKIAILGAGYGGVCATRALENEFRNDRDVEITLFDRNPFHTLMTELHEVASGRAKPKDVQIPLKKIFAGQKVKIQVGNVTAINFEDKVIESDQGQSSYHFLILGPGAESDYFGTAGAQENSFTLWSLHDAVILRRHIETQFLKASREPDPAQRLKLLAFAVAGAGFTGMEMLGELLERKTELCGRYHVSEKEVTISLIEAHPEILPILPESLRKKSLKYLADQGTATFLGTPITEVRKDGVTVHGGTVIDTQTLIWTCGIKGAGVSEEPLGGKEPETVRQPQESDLHFNIRKKCRLQTNSQLQSVDHDGVFIVGDVVWYSERTGTLPQIVETALQTGAVAAGNIIAEMRGTEKKSLSFGLPRLSDHPWQPVCRRSRDGPRPLGVSSHRAQASGQPPIPLADFRSSSLSGLWKEPFYGTQHEKNQRKDFIGEPSWTMFTAGKM